MIGSSVDDVNDVVGQVKLVTADGGVGKQSCNSQSSSNNLSSIKSNNNKKKSS